MTTRQATGAASLTWLAKLWRTLPEPAGRLQREVYGELSEDAIALAPQMLRLARMRKPAAWEQEHRLFVEFQTIRTHLEIAAQRQALPEATAQALIAQSQTLWRALRTRR